MNEEGNIPLLVDALYKVLEQYFQFALSGITSFSIKPVQFSAKMGTFIAMLLFGYGLYALILKSFELSKISPIMTIGTLILVVGSSVILLNEVITLKQSIGILLGISSIILILG